MGLISKPIFRFCGSSEPYIDINGTSSDFWRHVYHSIPFTIWYRFLNTDSVAVQTHHESQYWVVKSVFWVIRAGEFMRYGFSLRLASVYFQSNSSLYRNFVRSKV